MSKRTTLISAAASLACLVALPAAAQTIESDENVTVETRVSVDSERPTTQRREIRVIRLRDDDSDVRISREIDDVGKADIRIVTMGEGADLSEEELKAIARARLDEREMVVFSKKEMVCEKETTGQVSLRVCSEAGRGSALKALRKARATVADDDGIDDSQKARALAALDARIAELEAKRAERD